MVNFSRTILLERIRPRVTAKLQQSYCLIGRFRRSLQRGRAILWGTCCHAVSLGGILLGDGTPVRLAPSQRARLVAALILLTIGGLSLVVLSWLALRMGRRRIVREEASLRQRRRKEILVDDWATKKLSESIEPPRVPPDDDVS